MIGLIDANSFYASCEHLFDASLWNTPVAVLANNDTIIIALDKKCKELGLKRGDSIYDYEPAQIIQKHGIVTFSSNYELYGDISDRIVTELENFTPEVEVYSIDEQFLGLSGFEHKDMLKYSRKLRNTVTRNVGIPLSLGLAPNKTLSKLANKISKKYQEYDNVYIIDSDEKRIDALKNTEISDVWGIGRQISKRLNTHGVYTAYDFSRLTRSFVRKNFTVTGERTWAELNDIKCFDLELTPPLQKGLCTSRSFMETLDHIDDIKAEIATYACICASHLRRQGTFAAKLSVRLETDRFRSGAQHNEEFEVTLPIPANTSGTMIRYAFKALETIYKKGYNYKKGGVTITKITPISQTNIYDTFDYREVALSKIEDRYARGFNRSLFQMAVMCNRNPKGNRRLTNLSKCPTTRFKDIMRLNCRKKTV